MVPLYSTQDGVWYSRTLRSCFTRNNALTLGPLVTAEEVGWFTSLRQIRPRNLDLANQAKPFSIRGNIISLNFHSPTWMVQAIFVRNSLPLLTRHGDSHGDP